MKLTTLCYIEKDGCYLMLYRSGKKNDGSNGKYIGVGGHFESGESPEECLLREVLEETGFRLANYALRGIVTFVSDLYETEYMFLYTATPEGDGIPSLCDEGELSYLPKEEVLNLRLWEGDKIFLRLLLEGAPFFSLKLCYEGERLVTALLNGKELKELK